MSVYVKESARHMGSRGHRVDVFTRSDCERVQTPHPNVRVVHLPVAGAAGLSKSDLFGRTEAFAEAVDGFREKGGGSYDLIHSHYWISGVVGQRLRSLWRCPHWISFHTLGTAKMAARNGHGETSVRIAEEARLARECDGLIAPTDAEIDRLAAMTDGCREKIRLVPCGVDLERFHPAGRTGPTLEQRSGPPTHRLLYAGRFDPMKGLRTLLTSIARLRAEPVVELEIVGGEGPDSPEHRRLLRLARDLGLEKRIHATGSVEHRRMPERYRAADAVVVASRYESFGLVLLESLACGTPVASTSVGVAPQVIRPGVNGYLANAGDDRSLAEAITRTLQLARIQDPATIRATVSGFGWHVTASRLLECYGAGAG
jgi:D-inositol-3-phosphate glycosyltransferase